MKGLNKQNMVFRRGNNRLFNFRPFHFSFSFAFSRLKTVLFMFDEKIELVFDV